MENKIVAFKNNVRQHDNGTEQWFHLFGAHFIHRDSQLYMYTGLCYVEPESSVCLSLFIRLIQYEPFFEKVPFT